MKPSHLLRNGLRKLIVKFQSRKIASVPLWLKYFQTTWTVVMWSKQGIGTQDTQDLTVEGFRKHLWKIKIFEYSLSTCSCLRSFWSHYYHPVRWNSTLVSPLWQDRVWHRQSQKDLTMQHLIKGLAGEDQGCETLASILWGEYSVNAECLCLCCSWQGEVYKSSLIRYLCHMGDGKWKCRST